MKVRIITTVMLLVCACLILTCAIRDSSAQPEPCTDEVGVSSDDTDCGFLSEKMDVYPVIGGAYPGIILYEDDTTSDEMFLVGFDTTRVRTRSWSLNEDFEWTFSVDGDDPKMKFDDYRTTHTGQFKVYTEYDTFNNDYTTIPCTLKYDGAKPASSALSGTVYFTEDSKEVTGSVDLESQMTPGCYMISADDSKWYYIDYFDEVDNKKLYLLSSFEEFVTR